MSGSKEVKRECKIEGRPVMGNEEEEEECNANRRLSDAERIACGTGSL